MPDLVKVVAFIGWAAFTFVSHYFAKARLLIISLTVTGRSYKPHCRTYISFTNG